MATMRMEHSISATGPFTVGDLRAFVEAVKEARPETPVRVDYYRGDQRDPGYATLKVSLA